MGSFTSTNPERIYSQLINEKINKKEALERLTFLIQESHDAQVRIKSLEIIGKINIANNEVFNLLENCLISDDDQLVRVSAAKMMALYFPKKGLKPLKWAIHNETSPLVLKTISELFEDLEDIYFK